LIKSLFIKVYRDLINVAESHADNPYVLDIALQQGLSVEDLCGQSGPAPVSPHAVRCAISRADVHWSHSHYITLHTCKLADAQDNRSTEEC
jgi:hypothetical protein